MKKWIVALVALASLGVQASSYKDGTYTGEGRGNASTIQVEVVVAKGKIVSVKVLKHGETEMLVNAAQKKLSKAIVRNNGTQNVEAVTGASNSSKGIIEAVNNALKAAK